MENGDSMFLNIQEANAFFNQRYELGVKPGLSRMHELLTRIGNPEKRFRAVHIAGTNGKGSTLHFLKTALRENGYDVGVFTSPSFHGLRGHIYLNDDILPESDWLALLNQLHPHILAMDEKGMAPSAFEILTAIAFLYFAEHGEIALIEAGMGGRFDTTNMIQPELSIITKVAKDHTTYLGETEKEIAWHKAGIIKPNIPVIIGRMSTEALDVIRQEAKANGAPLYELDNDFRVEDRGEQTFWEGAGMNQIAKVKMNMKGNHQLHNLGIALQALNLLEKNGYPVDWQKAEEAIGKIRLPGRFEQVKDQPLVIIDAAHNPDGIKALIQTVEMHYPNCGKHAIVAMFHDKATDEMLELLNRHFDEVSLTSFQHPRVWDINQVGKKWRTHVVAIEPDYRRLLEELDDGKIHVITGSLHFVAEVRNYFL